MVTSIEPIGYLIQRVAGPEVQVHVLIPPGADPHTFQLSPRDATELTQADLFFQVGLALEERILEKVRQGRPDFPVVDLGRGLRRLRMHHAHHDHEHHDDAEESPGPDSPPPTKSAAHEANHPHPHQAEGDPHEQEDGEAFGWDPHIWLSPPLLKEQARRVAEALSHQASAQAEQFRKNLAELEAELDALHAWIGQQLAPFRGRSFFVFHPSFGYFAETYGLRQIAVQVEGKTPTPRDLQRLIELAQSENARIILAQPQFDHRSVQIVADAVGARVAVVNDLERNVLEGLKRMTTTLVESFHGSEKPKTKSET